MVLVRLGLALLLYAGLAGAVALEDPVQVKVENENDHVVLSARYLVPVVPELAWEVLVDFEHMPRFVPNLRDSRVLSRRGNQLRVEQRGVVPVALLELGYTSVREIELHPLSEIHSSTVGGDSGVMRSVSRIRPGEAGTEITFRADWWPASSLVSRFGQGTTREILAQQFTAMRKEMLRRKVLTGTQALSAASQGEPIAR